MELVYECLDVDVAEWLCVNAPKPYHGQNYHQWLNEQYGLKKLVEHIWKLVGIASTCKNLEELRERMHEIYGKVAAFRYAVKLVRQSEESGQGLLFDPRGDNCVIRWRPALPRPPPTDQRNIRTLPSAGL